LTALQNKCFVQAAEQLMLKFFSVKFYYYVERISAVVLLYQLQLNSDYSSTDQTTRFSSKKAKWRRSHKTGCIFCFWKW